MKKIVLLVPLLIVMLTISFSQDLEIKWQQCYGGTGIDRVFDILQEQDGYLLAGWTGSQDGDVSFNQGGSDFWLVKIDTIGNMLWEKTFGGSEADNLIKIFPTQNNGYYLVGMSYSNDGDISNDPYPDSWDYWIVKIDSTTNIVWEKIVGGNGGDYAWTGTITNDGGIVALGWSGSEYGDVSINYGLYDIWMIKLNNEGEIEWDFTLGTDSQDYGQAIIQTSDGGFLVGGSSKLTGGGNLDCECHGQADGVLVKMDVDRNIEWQRCYGGSDYDGITALIEISDGYVFGAYTSSNDGDVSGHHGEADVWIVKIDFEGNIIWEQCYGGSRGETAHYINSNSNGDYTIVGYTKSNDGDVNGNHSLGEYDTDVWMFNITHEGEFVWQKCFGGGGSEAIPGLRFGVVNKSDNNYVIAAHTDYGPSYDVACEPYGGFLDEDWWVFEIKDTTTGMQKDFAGQNQIKVYPNPAKHYFIFEIPSMTSASEASVKISDIYGREVAGIKV
ncbi:MAG: hypothetical protein EOM06_10640, partial [Sphingobacteriia bacterium]|nr:hypothetical protein [Sphingobacteriia bacterium]